MLAKTPPHKLGFTWAGPKRIVKAKYEQVFEVEEIVLGTRECVHAIRIIPYRDNMRDTDVSD